MDLIGTLINSAVVTVVGIVLWVSISGRFTAQDERMDRLDGRMDRLEGKIDRLEETVSGRIDALRSDLTQVALAVGAKPRRESG